MDGDTNSARPLLISVLDTARATGEKNFVHAAILGLALAVGVSDDRGVAATLHGAADHLSVRGLKCPGSATGSARRPDPRVFPGRMG
jgi:hypothetical protein